MRNCMSEKNITEAVINDNYHALRADVTAFVYRILSLCARFNMDPLSYRYTDQNRRVRRLETLARRDPSFSTFSPPSFDNVGAEAHADVDKLEEYVVDWKFDHEDNSLSAICNMFQFDDVAYLPGRTNVQLIVKLVEGAAGNLAYLGSAHAEKTRDNVIKLEMILTVPFNGDKYVDIPDRTVISHEVTHLNELLQAVLAGRKKYHPGTTIYPDSPKFRDQFVSTPYTSEIIDVITGVLPIRNLSKYKENSPELAKATEYNKDVTALISDCIYRFAPLERKARAAQCAEALYNVYLKYKNHIPNPQEFLMALSNPNDSIYDILYSRISPGLNYPDAGNAKLVKIANKVITVTNNTAALNKLSTTLDRIKAEYKRDFYKDLKIAFDSFVRADFSVEWKPYKQNSQVAS